MVRMKRLSQCKIETTPFVGALPAEVESYRHPTRNRKPSSGIPAQETLNALEMSNVLLTESQGVNL